MSNLYRGSSIDASYQISDQLALRFSEEKIKMWKVNRRQTPSDGKSSHCLWQGELKKNKQKNPTTLIWLAVKYNVGTNQNVLK